MHLKDLRCKHSVRNDNVTGLMDIRNAALAVLHLLYTVLPFIQCIFSCLLEMADVASVGGE